MVVLLTDEERLVISDFPDQGGVRDAFQDVAATARVDRNDLGRGRAIAMKRDQTGQDQKRLQDEGREPAR